MNIPLGEHGLFVVLEGIDGSGTTTVGKRLCEAIGEDPRFPDTLYDFEPTDRPAGALIRQFLTRQAKVNGKVWTPPPETMAMLFSADRVDHSRNVIEPGVQAGKVVISDRYYYSTLAYQSLTSVHPQDETLGWLLELNKYSLEPDIVFVLNVGCDIAAKRRDCREKEEEEYEQDSLQEKLALFYQELPYMFSQQMVYEAPGKRFVHIDSELPVEDVVSACMLEFERTHQQKCGGAL